MTSLIFAPRAQRELRKAAVWVAEDNPAAADALLAASEDPQSIALADLVGAGLGFHE